MAKGKKNKGGGPKRPQKMAKQADKFELYLQSVQAPNVDVSFFSRTYKNIFKKPARILREDFCGSFAVCCAWAEKSEDNEAWGVDLEASCLEWGRKNTLSHLSEAQQARVHPVQGDVRTAETPPADVVAGQNFSYCLFKTRDDLREYFEACHKHLADKGVLMLDLFGGYESIEDDREEETEHPGYTYVWEQHKYDPINAFGTYKIHFRFPDKSEIKNAFVYEWRLWTIPEVRELLLEAGFDAVKIFWEGTDPDTGEGTGRYHEATQGDSDPAWTCYIAGVKGG